MRTMLGSNHARDRLIRTIIQGIIGVIIANLDMIVGLGPWGPEIKALIVALTMAVLSPIMAYFGDEEAIQDTFEEAIENEAEEIETEQE